MKCFLAIFAAVVGACLWTHAVRGEEALPQFKDGKGGQLGGLVLPDPQAFKTADGKTGWKLAIPGGRALATPALADGVLYVGGGFGSHEFYAVDAKTGKPVWTFKTGDDGPTAAVVAEGCVAYNTESCTLYVHDAKTGKVLWQRWLGDPLMSQPAIDGGRLFMAYPGGGKHHLVAFELKTGKVLWDRPIKAEVITAPVVVAESVYAATCEGTLYRFGAETGKEHWAKACNATSAPVVKDGKVWFSQRLLKEEVSKAADGKEVKTQVTMEGMNAAAGETGELAYKEPQGAVRAAYLMDVATGAANFAVNNSAQYAFVSEAKSNYGNRALQLLENAKSNDDNTNKKIEELKKDMDAFAKRKAEADPVKGLAESEEALALSKRLAEMPGPDLAVQTSDGAGGGGNPFVQISDELRDTAMKSKQAATVAAEVHQNLKVAEGEQAHAQKEDASVGFANAPADANVGAAQGNIGQVNVKAIWAYQGSRPCPVGDRFVSVNGNLFRGTDSSGDKTMWENRLESKVDATRPATPPSLAGGKVYMGTADGKIICADPKDGKTQWSAEVGGRIIFQPAVADGRVYVATNEGMLVCLETGDPTATGWAMWGGSAGHNGPMP